jgi:hypothetical protein
MLASEPSTHICLTRSPVSVGSHRAPTSDVESQFVRVAIQTTMRAASPDENYYLGLPKIMIDCDRNES